MKKLLRKVDYQLLLILSFSAFLRFYDYQNRWALAHDQAWFAVIARYAIETFQLPLLGPFASGGPYQTGGEWFWIVMFGTVFAKTQVIAPWIFMTLLSIFQVLLMYWVGKELYGRKFGLLVSLLTAVSTSQTLQATNLTNQMPTGLFATLLIWSIARYLSLGRSRYIFLAGLSVGFASSIHLEGVLLLPVIFIFILIGKVKNGKQLLFLFLGMIIPWLPVLYADSNNHFNNTKNMLSYFDNEQSKVSYEVLGRRWLTFAGSYVPDAWARVIGGRSFLGYIEIFFIVCLSIYSFLKKEISKIWYIIGISTFLIFVILRYVRTPLYENYITFLHPFIIFLTAFMLYKLIKINKIIGIVFLFIIIFLSVLQTAEDIGQSTNLTSPEVRKIANILQEKYPADKFMIYDYNSLSGHLTLPLVLYLYADGKLSEQGRKIGLGVRDKKSAEVFSNFSSIFTEESNLTIYDLDASSSASLAKAGWAIKSPKFIYDSVQNWYKKNL